MISLDQAPSPLGRRSPASYRAILEAAAALVGEIGFHSVTIELIAARAQAGKQTIYRWWPSKPALFVEVYDHLVSRALLDVDTGSVAGDLTLLLERLFEKFREGPASLILAGLIGAAQGDPVAAAAIQQGLVIGRRDLLTGPIGRAIRRGELHPGFDGALACAVVVALVWREVLLSDRALDADYAATVVECALKSGAPRGPAG